MKNKILKKGLAIGIICLLMLVITPNVIGHNNKEKTTQNVGVNDIEFPKENGPYEIFVEYWIWGVCPDFIYITEDWIQIGLNCRLKYPKYIKIELEKSTVVIVDGESQDHLMEEYYGSLRIYGLNGRFPPCIIQDLNEMLYLFSNGRLGKNKLYGTCDEIDFDLIP